MAAKRLPVPRVISESTTVIDNETDSGKSDVEKIRVYPAERGQWSLHICADLNIELFSDIKHLVTNFENVTWCPEIHLSLSRGYFVTRYHQIRPIIESLSKNLSSLPPFFVCLSQVKILENEEKTRIFVCLCDDPPEISTYRETFNVITESVESVLLEFASSMKPCKYETPFLIHTSLAWCLPKFRNEAVNLVTCINEVLEEPFVIEIKEVTAKIGNVTHTFKLKDVSN